jgi:hypothetical protein
MSFRDDLLRVYATNQVGRIADVQEYKSLCAQHGTNPQFGAERDRIEIVKQKLEQWLEGNLTVHDQAEQALSVLLSERYKPADLDLYFRLITLGYKPRWSPQQQDSFDASWKRISLTYDYFLSFTTRYEPEIAGDNPVNINYKYFIQHVLGVAYYDGNDRKKTNLLASSVHKHLERNSMHGFFYPHTANDNSVVAEKLEAACAGSRVFVQLVQNIMFTDPSERKNYCFFEYEKVRQLLAGVPNRERLILFIVAEKDQKLVRQPLVPVDYRDWHRHISSKGAPYLAAVDLQDRASRIEDLQKILDKIHDQIEDELLKLTEVPY